MENFNKQFEEWKTEDDIDFDGDFLWGGSR